MTPPDSPVGEDVQNANRVVEEYLREGEARARMFQRATATGAGGTDFQDMGQRLFRATSDLMSFWMEMVARSAAGAAPVTPDRAAGTAAPSPTPAPADSVRIGVEVDSARPVKVTVDLRKESRGSDLSVDRLHVRGAKAPPLVGVLIEPAEDQGIVVRLRIDAAQPTGVYTGVILNDATSLPAGTIAVEVLSRRGGGSPRGRFDGRRGRR